MGGHSEKLRTEASGQTKAAVTWILTLSLQDRETYTSAQKGRPLWGILLWQLDPPDMDQEHVFASVPRAPSSLLGAKG